MTVRNARYSDEDKNRHTIKITVCFYVFIINVHVSWLKKESSKGISQQGNLLSAKIHLLATAKTCNYLDLVHFETAWFRKLTIGVSFTKRNVRRLQ